MREWKKIEGFDFKEIIFEEYNHIAKITINRERYRNAFTPLTLGRWRRHSTIAVTVWISVWSS